MDVNAWINGLVPALGVLLGAVVGVLWQRRRASPLLVELKQRVRNLEQELGSTQSRLRVSDSKLNDSERESALRQQHADRHREQSEAALDGLKAELSRAEDRVRAAETKAERVGAELGKDLEVQRQASKKLRDELKLAQAARTEALKESESARHQALAANKLEGELRTLLAGATADKDQRQRELQRLEAELRDWQQKFAALGAQIKPRVRDADAALRERDLAQVELRRAHQEIVDLRDALRQARAGSGADRRHERDYAELQAKVLEYGLERDARGAEIERLQAELRALQSEQLRRGE